MYTINLREEEVAVTAPAKINLHLEVGERRDDGYHGITSLFQMISLFDMITIRSAPHRLVCEIEGLESIRLKENIMYQAYKKFKDTTGIDNGIIISIDKSIPMKAGLGGGSSDAASVLIGLNKLWKTGFSAGKLAEIGSEIGSDVPFFCYRNPAAIVRGRGEKVESIRKPITLHGVIVLAPVEMETAKAYSLLDEKKRRKTHHLSDNEMHNQYRSRNPEKWSFYNSFQEVIIERFTVIGELIRKLYTLGAVFASLTGSGSAVFGLFNEESMAAKAEKKIRSRDIQCWKIKMLDRKPNTIVQYL